MTKQPNPTNEDRPEDCPCNPSQITWDEENSYSDTHQHIVPGTCDCCGEDYRFIYTEVGIKNAETGAYVQEY